MPDMTVIEAVRHIRAKETDVPAKKRTFMIALTAEAEEEMRQACLAAGVDRFMTKPVRPDRVRDVLSAVGFVIRHRKRFIFPENPSVG